MKNNVLTLTFFVRKKNEKEIMCFSLFITGAIALKCALNFSLQWPFHYSLRSTFYYSCHFIIVCAKDVP